MPVRCDRCVFAPGDDADALASTRASGADSMVVDLEEPQTPYPESERERGRKVAREFFDSLVPGELPVGVRARAAAVDGADA